MDITAKTAAKLSQWEGFRFNAFCGKKTKIIGRSGFAARWGGLAALVGGVSYILNFRFVWTGSSNDGFFREERQC